MIKAGFETTDPLTGTRMLVVQGAEETKGRGWVLEVYCPEGASASILEHVHLHWTETFEIMKGYARYSLGGEEKTAQEGEKIVMPAGIRHIHPWNDGEGELVYRQINDFGEPNPEAVSDVLGAFATLHYLAEHGKVNAKGLPKDPLQFAATLRTLTKHHGYDAAVPIGVQKVMAASLGRLAKWLGYRGVHKKFSV